MDRIVDFIQDLTAFHAELANELPNLRIVVDNTRAYSDVKKRRRENIVFPESG